MNNFLLIFSLILKFSRILKIFGKLLFRRKNYAKNENFKTLSEISKKFEYILIYRKGELLEALDNNMPVIVLNKKKNRPHNSGVNKKTSKTDLILKTLNDFIAKQEQFNKFVMKQFKQHGWVK